MGFMGQFFSSFFQYQSIETYIPILVSSHNVAWLKANLIWDAYFISWHCMIRQKAIAQAHFSCKGGLLKERTTKQKVDNVKKGCVAGWKWHSTQSYLNVHMLFIEEEDLQSKEHVTP